MRAMIISGGTIETEFALEFIQKYQPEYIVAADHGLLFCLENDLKVDMVVGDFDSAPKGVLEQYTDRYDVPVRTFNPVKDATDTEIAVRQVMEAGADEVVLLGATGTRLDHVIGNMQCLHIFLEAGIRARIVDSHNEISLHDKGFTIKKAEQFGAYVSFIPAGDEIRKLTLKGFKYPLRERDVTNRDSLCISNEVTEDVAEVMFEDGRVFMIQSRDK